jgi:hypothetical protein
MMPFVCGFIDVDRGKTTIQHQSTRKSKRCSKGYSKRLEQAESIDDLAQAIPSVDRLETLATTRLATN